MQLKQRLELRKLLVPQLTQSLKVLAMPLLDLRHLVEQELESNPFLEETQPKDSLKKIVSAENIEQFIKSLPSQDELGGYNYPDSKITTDGSNLDFRLSLITKKTSLQEVLLRQLGMFTNTDEEFRIGREIIGNIDDNGYLKATIEEMTATLNVEPAKVANILQLIQEFEPAGVGGRTIPECLLIQLRLGNENDPLLNQIVECHLEDVAKKNYSHIAKSLKEPLGKIEPLIKKILKLNPKPGRNYSLDEIQRIIPDIVIDRKGNDLEITINNEDIPSLNINKVYRDMLKKDNLDEKTKEFLTQKLRNAVELLRSISRRQTTLRRVLETIVEIQQEALQEGLSHLKPLIFQDVAQKIDMHESTISRVVMNKYVKTPYGIVALKDFFSSHIHDHNGQAVSSTHVKKLIKDLIEQEHKKHPLSDQEICTILSSQKNLKLSRRTVTKYREELKILSSTYRRER